MDKLFLLMSYCFIIFFLSLIVNVFSPKTTVKITLQLCTVIYSEHKNKTAFITVLQATDRGLEPLLTESESAVLPLHQSASFLFLSDSTFILYRDFPKSQVLFLFF